MGWLATFVLAGGLAYVLTAQQSPLRPFDDPVVTETSINEVVVLPIGQAEVSGTLRRLAATDAVGPPLPLPITITEGTAVVEEALVRGERASVAWDGGRPFRLSGSGGGLDLGPTAVTVEGATTRWPLDDGVRVVLPGEYVVETPVAVGAAGLATPRDGVTFTADEETTIATTGWTIERTVGALHLEGPGSLVLEGDLVVRTRDGERRATRLALPDGPFVVDLAPGGLVTATVRGELDIT